MSCDITMRRDQFIVLVSEKIDSLVERADGLTDSKRLKASLMEIKNKFFKDPENFTFTRAALTGLQNAGMKEEMLELVEILKGTSEIYPLAGVKRDGEGRAYESISVDEQKEIQSSLFIAMTEKIERVAGELGKRKNPADKSEEGEKKKIARQAFLERAEAVRIKQERRSTKAGALELVCEDGMELKFLDPIFQNDKDVVLAAVKQNGRALQFVHSRLRNDNDVVREALKHPDSDFIIEHAGNAFRENREQLLEAIRSNEMAIGYGNDELVEDRAFILDAIRANPMVIQLLDESLRNDRELMMAAVREDGIVLQFVGAQIYPFAEAICKLLYNGFNLRSLDEVFRNDKDVVLAAVRRDGNALEYASDELKGDRELVLEVVRRNGNALAYASETLRNDPELQAIASMNSGPNVDDID